MVLVCINANLGIYEFAAVITEVTLIVAVCMNVEVLVTSVITIVILIGICAGAKVGFATAVIALVIEVVIYTFAKELITAVVTCVIIVVVNALGQGFSATVALVVYGSLISVTNSAARGFSAESTGCRSITACLAVVMSVYLVQSSVLFAARATYRKILTGCRAAKVGILHTVGLVTV